VQRSLLYLQRNYGNRYVQQMLAVCRAGDEAGEPAVTPVSDDTVYKVSDKRAMLRSAPPALASTGNKIPWDAQIRITQRSEKDGKTYVYVKKAYGDQSDWGWTLESNIEVSDVPSAERYGAVEASGYVIKHDKYLQQETVNALGAIDNPIEITNSAGEVTDSAYLRLTDCIYPATFVHKSQGHYTGHCVDVGFADEAGAWKAYGGQVKSEIENQGDAAFDTVVKHSDHFHGCVAYPTWVSSRTTSRLKELIRERKDEF
jgi:hypothetical protein